MTPLAHQIVKELTLPIKDRTFKDSDSLLLKRMNDIHCFDITAIIQAAYELSKNPEAFEGSEATTFLPAPKTWLEESRGNERFGWLLEDIGGGKVRMQNAMHQEDNYFGIFGEPGTLSLTAKLSSVPEEWRPEHLIPAYLLFINSPKIIGRRIHSPHRGLEKKLLAKRSVIGHFPLHAWTEIKLEIGLPKDQGETGVTESHLTGERALHFCRSYLRVRLGRLEIVKAHWRGDASIGIKQSRYKLKYRTNSDRITSVMEKEALTFPEAVELIHRQNRLN